MPKSNLIYDTIVVSRDTITVIHKDTIVKVLEIVNQKAVAKSSAFASFFDENVNFFTFLASLAAILALIVSIKAIVKTARDSRHQILVGKFEEMYSLLYSLLPEYQLFFQLDTLLQNSNNPTLTITQRQTILATYKAELAKINSYTNVEEVLSKAGKLAVLANAYLDKELKNEIIGYSKLFEIIIIVTTQNNMTYKQKKKKNGFPTYENVHQFAGQLSRKLIDKINFGGKNEDKKIFIEYFQGKFQKQLGL